MSYDREIILRVQEDNYNRCLAHAWFADVAIMQERKAYTTDEIAKLLSTVKGRSGKVGLAILVQRPLFTPASDDASLRGRIVQAFTILEHPTINAGSIGTGKSAEEAGIELLNLFHLAASAVPSQCWSALPEGAMVPDDSFDTLNAWETRLQLFASPGRTERCGPPLIEPDSGLGTQEVTLSTATAGAAIYYTIDGTYPRQGNGTLYAAPFVPGAGVLLRAAAEKAGLQQSSVSSVQFS